MNSNFFKLKWRDVWGAVVNAGLVALLGYVVMVGDVFALDWRTLVNATALAAAATLLQALLTTRDGDFVGVVPVK